MAQHRGRHRTPLLAGPGPVHAGRGAEAWGRIYVLPIYTDLYAAGDSTEGCCHGCLLVLRLAVLEAGELVVVVGELAGLGRHQGVQVRSLASSSLKGKKMTTMVMINFNIDTLINTKYSEKP